MSFGGQAIQFIAPFQASLHGQALIILQLAYASLQHGIWAPERQSRTFQSSSGLALDIQKITSTTFHWSKQVIGQSRSQRRGDRPTSWCDEQPIGGREGIIGSCVCIMFTVETYQDYWLLRPREEGRDEPKLPWRFSDPDLLFFCFHTRLFLPECLTGSNRIIKSYSWGLKSVNLNEKTCQFINTH